MNRKVVHIKIYLSNGLHYLHGQWDFDSGLFLLHLNINGLVRFPLFEKRIMEKLIFYILLNHPSYSTSNFM